MALGQNAANVAPPSLRGSLLLTWRARRLSLPNRARMSRPTRHRPEPASVEGRLSVDAEMLLDQLKRIASPPWTLVKLNRLMIQSLIDLNGQQPTLTWTMTMTLSLITLLAWGGVWIYVLGLMLDTRSMSIKPNTDLWSKQHQKRNAWHICKRRLIGPWLNRAF